MIKRKDRNELRAKKHLKLRKRYSGTSECPRLSVFRSDSHIYAQIIDDSKQITLVSASTVEKTAKSDLKFTNNIEAATYVGKLIGERAKDKGIVDVVFDRGGYIYQGKVSALADAAREAGLNF